MPNNTPNDYKEAIRIKFEREKDDGIYSDYLSNPSQASLRDLCWRIFKSDIINSDDLAIYYNFFKFNFDPNNENTSTSYTDKFKKVGDFLKREKEPAKIDTVNLAGILVGFELRPYQKFNRSLRNEGKEPVNDSNNGEPSSDVEEIMRGCNLPQSDPDEKGEKNESGVDKNTELVLVQKKSEGAIAIYLFKSFIEKICYKFSKRVLRTISITVIIFLCGFLISHYAFPDKECMQWSGDHYEMVDCDLKIQGLVKSANIEILDPTLVHLKKIKVCDTTTYFDKNGVAIIWYAKTANGVDFFDAHGRHPENNSPLRPVTRYILNKYVRSDTGK
ncbi:hypothetical protein [Flavobacterium sp. UGB4466]|uniref:hypothetical protein n=1 Tax=Flavobacterium sp. UGB4466 TaxID=2730889 RepID=UPI00192B32CF|nr:hypothetical protein [Flavobacterium sp. UGB4466]